MPVTPERSTLTGLSPAVACIRRQWDSNSSTHGPASRPWRLKTISDVDSIVSIFNMGFSSTFGSLLPHAHCSQLLPCSAPEKRPDWALTFQVQSPSRDGIIENGYAL